ncbi:MAG TPA: hypothetical protein VHL58_00030, partial [Thermoanaerobaculia bacterium]|nr:hypothetical protein [Thermoanaerobaculia bacterium]
MPRYRFSWDAFSDEVVNALADAYGYADRRNELGPREWLTKAAARPDEVFVAATKTVLIDSWLAHYPGAQAVVEDLILRGLGPANRRPRSASGYAGFLHDTRNTANFRRIV